MLRLKYDRESFRCDCGYEITSGFGKLMLPKKKNQGRNPRKVKEGRKLTLSTHRFQVLDLSSYRISQFK